MCCLQRSARLTLDNQITLTGFAFVLINVATMLYYTPNMDQDCPTWVYWSWAIGLFLYQTFDAVDGSQAYVHTLTDFLWNRLLTESTVDGRSSQDR